MTGQEFKILIAGEEVYCNSNITINEEMLETSSVILNNCYPASWELDKDYTSRFYFPQNYSSCQIYRGTDLIFSGVVKNSGTIALRPQDPKYATVEVLDYKTLLSEGKTLDFVIKDKTILEAIQQVINAVSDYGFVLGNVQLDASNEVIGAYSTLDKTAYDMFQYISEITGCRWFTRTIDENTIAIDFIDADKLTRAGDIQYTTNYFQTNKIVDMTYSFNTNDYRNKQTITSDEVLANIETNETLYSNGYDTTYILSEKVGAMTSIEVNGVAKTIISTEQQAVGLTADYYYTIGSTDIITDDGTTPLVAGTPLTITYTALVKAREIIFNTDEINRISTQTNRNGVISRYENREDILSSSELSKVAQTYINYNGKGEIELKITTENNDLFSIGQQVYFDISSLTDLKTDYMIKSKETQLIQSDLNYYNVFYVYTLTNTYDMENDINYFDNQRRKANGNLQSGDMIDRNIDIENTINIIFKNITIEEITPSGDNDLNAVLNAPFIE